MTLPWYPRDMGKYARDTGTLSLMQHGAYNLLLDHYYSSGPIDAFEQCRSNAGAMQELMPDHSPLYRLCKAMSKPEQDSVDFVLKKYFALSDDGFYRHAKCDEVIEEQTERHEKRVNAAKQKGKNNSSNAGAMQEQCRSNAPQIKNQTKTKIKSKEDDFSDEIDEDDFLRQNFDIGKVLKPEAIEEARRSAPGWDVYVLIGDFNSGVKNKKLEIPKNPDKAFPAWCKAVKKGKRP